jgi:hypothetical protein
MAQINKPSEYFNTLLYSGDGTSPRNLTGVGFQPDFTWIKQRSSTNTHVLWDAVRNAGADKEISTAFTSAEGGQESSLYGYLSSFDSDGFTATTGSTNIGWVNNSGQTYVSWNWKANGSGVSNTDGSITSTVSANTTSGFSIVKYTGTGASATVGHGLGSAPKMIIIKKLNGTPYWNVGHTSLNWTSSLFLNATDVSASSNEYWNSTAPTSSVWSMVNNDTNNGSGGEYIAYCFAEKKGFSKFGSYIGNFSTNGTFVYTGFKPAMVIIKCSSTGAENWRMFDNKRIGYNPANYILMPSNTNAEDTTGSNIDFLSNGFKIREANGGTNYSGETYIYMAFAEEPLVGTNNIPATAR